MFNVVPALMFGVVPSPPVPWIIESADVQASAASGTLAANTVYCYLVEIHQIVTVSGMKIRTGSTAAGTIDAGIYDSSGNLLIHCTAPIATIASQNPQTFAFSASLTLNPDRYILACTPSNSTDTFIRSTAGAGGMVRVYNATNAAAAGVLPASTGAMTLANNCPGMALVVVGGAI